MTLVMRPPIKRKAPSWEVEEWAEKFGLREQGLRNRVILGKEELKRKRKELKEEVEKMTKNREAEKPRGMSPQFRERRGERDITRREEAMMLSVRKAESEMRVRNQTLKIEQEWFEKARVIYHDLIMEWEDKILKEEEDPDREEKWLRDVQEKIMRMRREGEEEGWSRKEKEGRKVISNRKRRKYRGIEMEEEEFQKRRREGRRDEEEQEEEEVRFRGRAGGKRWEEEEEGRLENRTVGEQTQYRGTWRDATRLQAQANPYSIGYIPEGNRRWEARSGDERNMEKRMNEGEGWLRGWGKRENEQKREENPSGGGTPTEEQLEKMDKWERKLDHKRRVEEGYSTDSGKEEMEWEEGKREERRLEEEEELDEINRKEKEEIIRVEEEEWEEEDYGRKKIEEWMDEKEEEERKKVWEACEGKERRRGWREGERWRTKGVPEAQEEQRKDEEGEEEESSREREEWEIEEIMKRERAEIECMEEEENMREDKEKRRIEEWNGWERETEKREAMRMELMEILEKDEEELRREERTRRRSMGMKSLSTTESMEEGEENKEDEERRWNE